MIAGVRMPLAIAASMKASERRLMVEARAIRAKRGAKATVSTTTMFQKPAPERGRDQDAEQQGREGQEDVEDPADDAIDPAAEITRRDAERRADDGSDRRRDHAEQQRRAGAVDDAGQHVAAELVGPEPVLRRRRQVDAEQALRDRVIGCDLVGEDRHQDDGDQHDEEEQRHAIAARC